MTMSELYEMPVSSLSGDLELCHVGVKGMKWGRRKAKPVGTGGSSGKASPTDEAARKEARKQKAKKAAKIGAAVAGAALAAYGTYKLSKWLKGTNAKIAAGNAHDSTIKDFMTRQNDSISTINNTRMKSFSLSASPASRARNAASNASRDSVAKAAKNVINYKRAGGNLRSLRSVEDLVKTRDLNFKWER